MIWHIFRKDFRLLWPLSLAVVLLGAFSALRTPFDGHFYGSQLEQLTAYLPRLVELGIAVVAVVVVHQDALSESQEDWLVRPLLRRDLAWAKVLFVLLTVNIPLMIIDVLVQLSLHFPPSISVGVGALHALFLVLMFSLPALMLGAITRSLVNAFLFALAAAIGCILLLAIAVSILNPGILGLAAAAMGMAWIPLWAMAALVAIGSAAALALQYTTRRTVIARSVGLATVFVVLSLWILLPRTVALDIQESIWGPSNSGGISLSFDPSSRGARSEPVSGHGYGIGPPLSAAAVGANAALVASVDKEIEKVGLPLSISGMHPGDVLAADQIDVRLVSLTGKVLYQGSGVCTREGSGDMCSTNRLELWASSANVLSDEELNLPIRLYRRIKDEPIRVEVSYALTRFVAHSTQMIEAIGGRKALPELGSCATRIDGDGDEIQMGCLTDVGAPACARLVLEDPQTHRHNPEVRKCNPNYGLYRRTGGLADAVDRLQVSIPFRDLSGLAHYPVDGTMIAHARLDVTAYDPVAHFRTSVTVPNVRLADWAPQKGEPTAPLRN